MRRLLVVLLTLSLGFSVARATADEPSLESVAARWAEGGGGGSPEFTRHIVPLFGKLGCNNRACHGSFQGQSGFRLSLFGFEPAEDVKALLEDDGDGLRVNLKEPAASLVLVKPTNEDEHEGGKRMDVGSWQYRMFRQWIVDGAKYETQTASKIVRFEIMPSEVILRELDETASLRTVAHFSDGSVEDVTGLTIFSSNDDGTAAVSGAGEVSAVRVGDTAIVAQYGGSVASTQVLIPLKNDGTPPVVFPPHNKVDEFVSAKLRKLNMQPSPLSNDAEFLRRVYLDLLGTLPTADESRTFLSDTDPGKRERLIDELLDRPEYARHWGMMFSDWTGNGPYVFMYVTEANWMWQLWLEDKLARNIPYDELAYGFVCATSMEGRTREEFQAEAKEVMYKNEGRGQYDDGTYARRKTLDLYWIKVQHRDPATIALQTANAFLGLRLECAQCHNHPFDRWTKNDYDSFTSFFMLGRFCDPATGEEEGDRRRGYGWECLEPGLRNRFSGSFRKTPPRILGGELVPYEENGKDPRITLWEWMRSPDNEHFSPAIVNRIWAHYLGVGIVEPADDFNQGNPPSNPQLLEWLAKDFVDHKFDLKHLHRTILNSRTYQLSWQSNKSNKLDTHNFSHALLRRVPAEVLIDAVADVTGVANNFGRAPKGQGLRAVGQASPPQRHSLNGPGYAMKIFGRPDREKTCACERSNEPSVAQALYLINDQEINEKIANRSGHLARLLREMSDDRAIVEELYLCALSRYPTDDEIDTQLTHVSNAPSREAGMSDVMWSLLNMREFVFNH